MTGIAQILAGTGFGPSSLFTSGAQGAWYDPSDLSTLFQDANGTTPVTAVEQPVRLMLDRSKGLVLGSELITNGTFDSATGWNLGAGWTISGGQAARTTSTGASNLRFDSQILTVGRTFVIAVDVIALDGTLVLFCGDQSSITFTTPGLKTVRMRAAGDNRIYLQAANAATTVTIDNISVRELPGNHAVAPNDASRPVLRARYNVLTFSEQFDNAAWTVKTNLNIATGVNDPFGGTAASTLTASGGSGRIVRGAGIGNFTYTASVWLRRRTGSGAVNWELWGVGIGAAINVTTEWQRFTYTDTVSGGGLFYWGIRIASNGDAIDIAFAQLLTAADQASTGGAYQRVGAATDYDTSNPVWRPYLAFDGSDDSFSTSSIDFSGTDEMTVFAGVTKLSDVAAAMLIELSANAVSNAGAWNIQAPVTGGNLEYRYLGGGSTFRSVLDSGAAAPRTDVLTATQDISGDAMELRRSGVSVGTSALDQGTGNFGNYPLFIGSRNNASLRFNGRIYSLIVLGRTATAAEIAATEAWVNSRTGAY